MKQQLLALSLIATAGLFAAEGNNSQDNGARMERGACATCCCTPCCCKPCCVPKPKKCIDCECYVPQFYDLQCDWGLYLDAEFLYWYARETNLGYGMKGTSQSFGGPSTIENFSELNTLLVFAPSSILCVDAEWDPGFRVGIGWNDDCDGWDVRLNYTYYHNRAHDSTSVAINPVGVPALEGDQALYNPWMNGGFKFAGEISSSFITDVSFERLKAKWRLNWNQIDLELGRKYWLSKCFNLRPYASIRGAWWKTHFRVSGTSNTQSVDTAPVALSYFTRDRFTNSAWGVGFVGGLQPTWYVCNNFALYSNFDVSLLWGNFEAKKKERYEIQTPDSSGNPSTIFYYSNRFKESCDQMTPMIDVGLGIRWEETWCCDQYRTTLDLGWEHHSIMDQNHRVTTGTGQLAGNPNATDDILLLSSTFDQQSGDIGMGGFVLRLAFDF